MLSLPLSLLVLAAASPAPIVVPEVDELEVISVVDNFYDCFQKDEKCATRHNLGKVEGFDAIRLQAEMGLAYVIRAKVGAEEHMILFDFGLSAGAYENNLQRLGIDVSKAEALVVSHSHEDHYAGLDWAVRHTKAPVVYVGDGDAFLSRRFVAGDKNWDMGTLTKASLEKAGAKVVESPEASVLAGFALSSGRIAQKMPFEKVPPFLKMTGKDGKLVQDPMTHELALAFRVKGRGLVVVTSCAHAGVINSIEHLKAISGEDRLLAVIGGMHLTSAPDEAVDASVKALVRLNPEFIAPMHCTGQKAMLRIQNELQGAYVHPSVGTRLRFTATK